MDRQIAMIAGTSTCHMALSAEARPVPGVWGPYLGAVLPGLWLEEAGQSASGALLDHIVALHAASASLEGNPHAALVARIAELRATEGRGVRARPACAARLPRQPLALGRSACDRGDQRADAGQLAGCTGRLYYRTAVAIALGTRHILDALEPKAGASTRCTSPAATPRIRC